MTRDDFWALDENERWEILWDRGRYLFDTSDGRGLVYDVDGLMVIVEFDSHDRAQRITEFFQDK
jgi:hypothetical protein